MTLNTPHDIFVMIGATLHSHSTTVSSHRNGSGILISPPIFFSFLLIHRLSHTSQSLLERCSLMRIFIERRINFISYPKYFVVKKIASLIQQSPSYLCEPLLVYTCLSPWREQAHHHNNTVDYYVKSRGRSKWIFHLDWNFSFPFLSSTKF